MGPSLRPSRRALAIHEAGHAVAAWSFGKTVSEVSIACTEGSFGVCRQDTWGPDIVSSLGEQLRRGFVDGPVRWHVDVNIMIALAGGMSVIRLLGLSLEDSGYEVDYDYAVFVAKTISNEEQEAVYYLKWLSCRTTNLFRRPGFSASVERVADVLVATSTVNGDEFSQLIQ